MTATLAQTEDTDWLAAVIVHDAYHATQWRDMDPLKREKDASAFTLDVAVRLGLSAGTIEALRKDSIEGHPVTPFKKLPKPKTPTSKKRP